MKHRAFDLGEHLEKSSTNAKIFGEAFRLDESLANRFDENCRLDGYVDSNQIEHIRMYRTADDADCPEQWEVLPYRQDEAPLELLMPQNDT